MPAYDRVTRVKVEVRNLPQWFVPEVHRVSLVRYIKAIVGARHASDAPKISVVFLAEAGDSEAVAYDRSHRQLERCLLDLSTILVTVLVDSAPPWSPIKLAGELSPEAVAWLHDFLTGTMGECARLAITAQEMGMDISHLLETEALAREVMAFLAQCAPVKPERNNP